MGSRAGDRLLLDHICNQSQGFAGQKSTVIKKKVRMPREYAPFDFHQLFAG